MIEGSALVTSTARAPAVVPIAAASSSGARCSTRQPSRRSAALATTSSVESVRMTELFRWTTSGGHCRPHRQVSLHGGGKRREVERLLNVIVRARLQRFLLVFHLVQRRHHDDARRLPQL